MGCDDFRDELSARLDGEDDPATREAVDKHLAGCAGCTAWWEQASAVTRLARTAAGLPAPGLSPEAMAAVMAAAPARPKVARAMVALRIALLVVGLSQFFLGIAQISAYATTLADHGQGDTIGSVSPGHLWHESAAWNVAIGAGLAWLAWRRNRPAALIPVMTAFVAVLGLLTANDALVGRVDGGRILSHGLILAGYVLLLVMNLRRFRGIEPPEAAQNPDGTWGLRRGDDEGGGGPLAPVLPFPVRVATASRVTGQRRRRAV